MNILYNFFSDIPPQPAPAELARDESLIISFIIVAVLSIGTAIFIRIKRKRRKEHKK